MTPTIPSPISDQAAGEPIPMLLFCPNCGTQHIDAPEEFKPVGMCECAFQQDMCETCESNREAYQECWTNPPHKSHLCHACGNIWRPADIATTGVAHIKTIGKADTWESTAPTTGSAPEASTSADAWTDDRIRQLALEAGHRMGDVWLPFLRGYANAVLASVANPALSVLSNDQIREIWARETGTEEKDSPLAILDFAYALLWAEIRNER